MTKIIFDGAVTKGSNRIIDFSSDLAQKTAERVSRKVKPDAFTSDRKIVTPFYNRFLPERFCRCKEVEFYPGTRIKKHVDTYNSNGDIIRSKSFDESGTLTFDEKINPKTGYTKTMIRSDGDVITQEMRGNVLLKKEVRDYSGGLKYHYEYNPVSKKESITEVYDGELMITKKINGEEVFRHVKTKDGEINETVNDTRRGFKYYYEAGILTYEDGTKSKTPKFKRLTIRADKADTSTVYEYIPDERKYSCKTYNDFGAQVGETKFIHSEQMRIILDNISGRT